MKLWHKGYDLDPSIEDFTVGEDHILDRKLVYFDCLASLAHATMLESIGIITQHELQTLRAGLQKIAALNAAGDFSIARADEDCHTAIENWLISEYGEVGKKIHTSRSRNDQVLVALRLFMKAQLLEVINECLRLVECFSVMAALYQEVPIPGRTHMQLAMPSSLGLWAGAFAEGLLDDVLMLEQSLSIIDQCPLGSAAGYGSALALDRGLCAALLGFSSVQNNVLYASNSRAKLETVAMQALNQAMMTLSKASSDLMFFSLPEIGYLTLPEDLCSGSSLMPHKRNPCALELLRAKSGTMVSLLIGVFEIIRALPSGYHRDFQETKGPLFKSFSIVRGSLLVMEKHIVGLRVNTEKCLSAFRPELFATDEVLRLCQSGVPFREAYQKVAQSLDQIKKVDPVQGILERTHCGASGNLGLKEISDRILTHRKGLSEKRAQWHKVQRWFSP